MHTVDASFHATCWKVGIQPVIIQPVGRLGTLISKIFGWNGYEPANR